MNKTNNEYKLQPGTKVKWTRDLRPMPGHILDNDENNSLTWDTDLVIQELGIVQAITRTFFGEWVALVDHNGQLEEINVNKLSLVDTKL